MKKTLIALSVLAAGSANASVNLLDQDGVIVDLSGSAEVQLIQKIEQKNADADPTIRLDDGDITLNTTIPVNNNLNVVAGLSLDLSKTEDGNNSPGNFFNDELYAGFQGADFGTLTFGRQFLISDDAGIGKDYELGKEQLPLGATQGSEVVKYVYDNGQFYFGASHDINANDNGGITDARLGARFGGLDVRGYYYTSDDVGTIGNEVDAYNIEAEYVFGAVALAASFGNVEVNDADSDVIEAAGSYTMGKNTFALGYVYADADETNNVYANVTHQLHSNVKLYAELGWADGDTKEYDLGYVAGMEVLF
ncbi:porin [Photobacterium halotolerans]|uniref:Porin n=1 Tax=Photobacterium halotolerans TaxID=265726 RepID=A0A7X5B037_9GAMM|nr:porin [Photobacterium halotolerans]NAW67271.1 porin [Photobacterium halotolerans]NAW87409.1 porin [Photobacterium halotolerans]NAX48539.1 porin [Photobacterium halotolerans]